MYDPGWLARLVPRCGEFTTTGTEGKDRHNSPLTVSGRRRPLPRHRKQSANVVGGVLAR